MKYRKGIHWADEPQEEQEPILNFVGPMHIDRRQETLGAAYWVKDQLRTLGLKMQQTRQAATSREVSIQRLRQEFLAYIR